MIFAVVAVSSNSGGIDDTNETELACEAAKTDNRLEATYPVTSGDTTTDETSQESTASKCDKCDGHHIPITVCLLRLPHWLSLVDLRREQGSCSTSCPCCNSALLYQEDNLGIPRSYAQGKDEQLAQRLLTAIGGGAQAHSFEEAKAKQIQICKNILPRAMPLSVFATKNLVGGMVVIQPQHLQEAAACSQRQQVTSKVEITIAP